MLALGPRKALQACDRGDAAGPSITAQISGRCEPCMHYCARDQSSLSMSYCHTVVVRTYETHTAGRSQTGPFSDGACSGNIEN